MSAVVGAGDWDYSGEKIVQSPSPQPPKRTVGALWHLRTSRHPRSSGLETVKLTKSNATINCLSCRFQHSCVERVFSALSISFYFIFGPKVSGRGSPCSNVRGKRASACLLERLTHPGSANLLRVPVTWGLGGIWRPYHEKIASFLMLGGGHKSLLGTVLSCAPSTVGVQITRLAHLITRCNLDLGLGHRANRTLVNRLVGWLDTLEFRSSEVPHRARARERFLSSPENLLVEILCFWLRCFVLPDAAP